MSDLDLVLQTLPKLGEAELRVVRSVVNAPRPVATEGSIAATTPPATAPPATTPSATMPDPPPKQASAMDIIGLLADEPELADWISEEAMRQRELRPYFPRPTYDPGPRDDPGPTSDEP